MELRIGQDLFKTEARLAAENRAFFREQGLVVINLLGAPGAGKTSLIQQTVQAVNFPIAMISGSPLSDMDKTVLNSTGVPVQEIDTKGNCHIEAPMVIETLQKTNLSSGTLLWIENMGNIICSACFPLGEALRIVVTSVSEGEWQPRKYPEIFHGSDVVILNKIDLLPLLSFELEQFYRGVRSINAALPIFPVSCKTGEGFESWLNWLSAWYKLRWAVNV